MPEQDNKMERKGNCPKLVRKDIYNYFQEKDKMEEKKLFDSLKKNGVLILA